MKARSAERVARATLPALLAALLASRQGTAESVPAQPDVAVTSSAEHMRPSVEVTSTTVSGWHANGPGYGDLFERLNMTGTIGATQVGLRLDTATFMRPPSDAVEDRYSLEKTWLTWTGRSVDLVAGDSYISFGRGLSLSLRKVDELGLDTTIRGAKVLLHGDRLGGMLALGITNVQNVEEATGKSIDDPRDIVAATRLELTLPGGVTGGAHGSAIAFDSPVSLAAGERYFDRYFQGGPTIDAPRLTDWLSVYAEGVAQVRRTSAEKGAPSGYGVYGAASADFGYVAVLVEGKAYGDLSPVKPRVDRPEFAMIAYNNPPTAERLLQLLENPQRDIAGGRIRGEWRATPNLSVFMNYGLFYDAQGYSDPAVVGVVRPGLIHDPYGGIEARTPDGRSWVSASVGSRLVVLDQRKTLVRQDSHLEIDGALTLGGRWSATLHALDDERLKYESALLDRRFREGSVLVGLRRAQWGGIAAGYDYTTDSTQPRRDYWNANAEWNVTDSSSLRVLAGATRGGLRCVSGVCRTFPPFEGIKVSITLRF